MDTTRFKDLQIGQTFDFVSPYRNMNSFTKKCTKIGSRKYRDEDGVEHTVGSIDCFVYNVSLSEQS